MAHKKAQTRPIAKSTGKPKKKTGPKAIIPKNSPKRKRQIQDFKNKIKDKPVKVDGYTRSPGVPRFYETPHEMLTEMLGYFEYIKGEFEIRRVKVPAANAKGYIEVDEEVCVRKPEPPTITGMCLYLGFSGRSALERYKYDHAGFVDVVNYGITRVCHGYEINLHGSKCFGSMFAQTNIKAENWKQKQDVTADFSDRVIDAFNYIVPTPPASPEPQPESQPDPRDDSKDVIK